MAIKGKKKPKARSGRVVTPGPRPAYVAPKVPLFQRTGAKFALVLAIEAIIFSLLIGFGEQSEADRERERIGEFSTLIQASLGRAGEIIQPFPGGAQVLPQLTARLSELGGETPPDEETVLTESTGWASALGRAADGVASIQVPEEGLEPSQRLALSESRNLMQRGLLMFAALADQLGVAVQIEGLPQEELITTMQEQTAVASETFNAGYGKLQDVGVRAGLSISPTVPPGGGFPAGGIPGAPPGFDPTMPLDTEVVVPPAEGDGGGQGGNAGGGGGGGNG